MTSHIFSLSAILGSEVITGRNSPVAVINDVICNKDTGKITYIILLPLEGDSKEEQEDAIEMDCFAVHHSFFYFGEESDKLHYNAKLGNDDHSFFLDLPDHYDEGEVQDMADFNRYIGSHSSAAGHRSDNE